MRCNFNGGIVQTVPPPSTFSFKTEKLEILPFYRVSVIGRVVGRGGWLRATLTFGKIKAALNPLYKFLKLCEKVHLIMLIMPIIIQ